MREEGKDLEEGCICGCRQKGPMRHEGDHQEIALICEFDQSP